MKNKPDDLKAWVTITKIDVITDKLLKSINGEITIAIWTTEDSAIITLRSIFVKQTTLTARLPKILNDTNISTTFNSLIRGINRINPIPPSFRRIPANSIDPYTGASTWAFGNHRWIRYIGIFTKNPPMKKRPIKLIRLESVPIFEMLENHWIKYNSFIIFNLKVKMIIIIKGNEKITV